MPHIPVRRQYTWLALSTAINQPLLDDTNCMTQTKTALEINQLVTE